MRELPPDDLELFGLRVGGRVVLPVYDENLKAFLLNLKWVVISGCWFYILTRVFHLIKADFVCDWA